MMTFSDAIAENRRPEATLNFGGEDCFTSGSETLLFMKHEHAEYEMRGAELLQTPQLALTACKLVRECPPLSSGGIVVQFPIHRL